MLARHCGQFTDDLACGVCGEWLIDLPNVGDVRGFLDMNGDGSDVPGKQAR